MRTWLLPAPLPLVFGLACSPADELRSLHAPLSAPTISLCLAASFLHLRARMLLLPAGVHPSLSPIRAGKQVLAGAGVRAKASVPTAAQWLLWVGWGAQTAGSLVICRWSVNCPVSSPQPSSDDGHHRVMMGPGLHMSTWAAGVPQGQEEREPEPKGPARGHPLSRSQSSSRSRTRGRLSSLGTAARLGGEDATAQLRFWQAGTESRKSYLIYTHSLELL